MIRIVFSNRTERLLALLGEDLVRFRAERGAWEAPHLVFPGPGLRQYALRALARGDLKVAANLRLNYLDGFWRRFLPQGGDRPLRLLDRSALQGGLLGLLQDPDLLAEPVLEPVRGYLAGEPREAKALQLAEALARAFEAYALGRPDWLEAWRAGQPAATGAPAAVEAWQRRLWNALRDRLAALPETWLTLAEFFRSPQFGRVPFPGEAFFFGLGPFAQAYHEGFRALGGRCRVNLYVTTPCREMWDDLRGEWDQRGDAEDPFDTETRAHLALQRWGKAGREQVCQLCELTDWDVDLAEVESGGSRLLHRLQDEILTLGTGAAPAGPAAADDSIRILACPSPRREAEAVAGAIWDTVLAGGGRVRFSDLAVVLPEAAREDYLDHLRLAFAGARQIPWHLADQGPSLARDLAEGAIQLLRLAQGDRNRAQVLRALGHPAVARRWPDLALDRLADYCEGAGIVAGAGLPEPAAQPGLWTWGRGFRRTALGQLAGGAGWVAAGPDRIPAARPRTVQPVAEAADLTLFLRALLADLERLEGSRLGPRDWAARLRAFLYAYLAQPPERAGEAEARAMAGLAGSLERLEALEVPGLPPPQLGCREAAAVAEACFRHLLADTPGPFERGVAVAGPGALRGIPFQAVFMLGLGEGLFPAADPRDPLDLRGHRRRPGDLRRPEQDRYLFLEALLAARERLVLSYVARDPVTGEDLQPSPLILDLRDILQPALGAAGWRALEVRHPAHRHDLAYFPDLAGGGAPLAACHDPAARAEAEALWIGADLRRTAGVARLEGPLATWGLSDPARAALEERIHACGALAPAPGGPARDGASGPLRIRTAALRKWLECQIQGGAQVRLGLRADDDRDPAEVAEEPFGTGFLDHRGALRAALWAVLATGRPVEEACREQLADLREAARAPDGWLAEGERAAAVAQVQGWLGLLPPDSAPWAWRFGPARTGPDGGPRAREREPLDLVVDLGGTLVSCRLEGTTGPECSAGALLLAERKPGRGLGPKDRRDLFRAWFDQVLLAAAGILEGPRPALLVQWSPEGGGLRTATLPALDRDRARGLLQAWIREALAEPRWTLMPLEAVLQLDPDGARGAGAMAAWIEAELEGDHPGFSSLHGPLPRAAEAPPEPDWRERAHARMGPFLDWVAAWEPEP